MKILKKKHNPRLTKLIVCTIALFLLLVSVNFIFHLNESPRLPDIDVPDTDYVLTSGEFPVASPEDLKMNATRLYEIHEYIGENAFNLDSIIINRNGYTVEYYPSGEYNESSLHFITSCTKSIISSLVG